MPTKLETLQEQSRKRQFKKRKKTLMYGIFKPRKNYTYKNKKGKVVDWGRLDRFSKTHKGNFSI